MLINKTKADVSPLNPMTIPGKGYSYPDLKY